MIVLHGRADSSNVQKILWLFDELDLPFERIDRGGAFGGLDTAEFRLLNPNGRVPVIVDGELVLWESHAILRHYAYARLEAGLLPDDPAARAHVEMALDWAHTTLWTVLRPIYSEIVGGRAAATDPPIRAALDAATGTFESFAWLLADQSFVGGPRFSIGDIPVAVSIHRYLWMGGDLAPWPTINAWHTRCAARPPYGARLFAKGGTRPT